MGPGPLFVRGIKGGAGARAKRIGGCHKPIPAPPHFAKPPHFALSLVGVGGLRGPPNLGPWAADFQAPLGSGKGPFIYSGLAFLGEFQLGSPEVAEP